MAARWYRFFLPENELISCCVRLLGRQQLAQNLRQISSHCLRTGDRELGFISRAKLISKRHAVESVSKSRWRVLSTSAQRRDNEMETDQHIDYKSIPRIVRESLLSKGHGSDILQNQINILNKLIQVREGEAKIEAVQELSDKLSHKHIYELAAAVYGLAGIVGEDALAMCAPLFRFASFAGNTDAQYSYAKLLQTGEGVIPDPIEAAKMFQELSEKGHPFAQFSLAQLYYAGIGVEQDFKNALELYQVSAQNGILPAYTFLGNMHRTGQGVEENPSKAFELYQEGADKGEMSSLMAVAYCYSHGTGVEVDHNKSFDYHKLAADKGYPSAQYNIGVHYFAGRGVELDMKKAAEYFQLAANQGFELAQINLGNMYYNGLGVEKDLRKARELYQQAAKTNSNAQLLLEELESEINKTTEKME